MYGTRRDGLSDDSQRCTDCVSETFKIQEALNRYRSSDTNKVECESKDFRTDVAIIPIRSRRSVVQRSMGRIGIDKRRWDCRWLG